MRTGAPSHFALLRDVDPGVSRRITRRGACGSAGAANRTEHSADERISPQQRACRRIADLDGCASSAGHAGAKCPPPSGRRDRERTLGDRRKQPSLMHVHPAVGHICAEQHGPGTLPNCGGTLTITIIAGRHRPFGLHSRAPPQRPRNRALRADESLGSSPIPDKMARV
jgi:hypothetical protein